MVWHIVKKDWKLLWPFVLMVASLHWITALVLYGRGLFSEDITLEMLSDCLPILAFSSSMFLIVAIVHQEAIPGMRQDWLTRPVPRGVLLFEKFFFVVITVEGPIFVANLGQGLANGFLLGPSLFDAIVYVAFLLFFLVLPIFTFASVTKNMTEAFIFGCGCTLIIGTFLTLTEYWDFASHHTLSTVTHSGIGWIGEILRFGLVLVAASVILGLQYFRRKTELARVLVVCFGLSLLVSSYLPWKQAFALETRLSPRPEASAALNIAFDPTRGRFKPSTGLSASEDASQGGGSENDRRVFLPLRITGISNDAILLADRVDVYLIDHNGRVVYHGTGNEFEMAQDGPQPKDRPQYQQISIPGSIYQRVRDRFLTVRLDYSMTIFGLNESFSLPALNGDVRTLAWGWCQTRMNETSTAVSLHCMKPGREPSCATAFLKNMTSGAQNPPRSSCLSEYAPFYDRPLPDDMARFGVNLSFRDPSGLAHYPVDGAQLLESRLIIREYGPEDHFTRTVMIASATLMDWESQ